MFIQALRRASGHLPLGAALVASMLFGAATPASKVLLSSLTPFHLAGLLYMGAAAGVLPFVLRRSSWRLWGCPPRRTRLQILGAIGFGGILGPVLLLFGLRMASSASVALWLNLELVVTILLGFLVFHDRLTRRGVIAAAAILLAAVLLSVSEGPAGATAGMLIFAACLCWGVDNHLTALIDGVTPAQTTFLKGIVAGPMNLLIGAIASPLHIPPSTFVFGLGVGAITYGTSIMLYIMSAQQLGASRSQIVFSSSPFFGVILSAIILGESISFMQSIAVSLMIVSVASLLFENHAHLHLHASTVHDHWHRHDELHHEHGHEAVDPGIWHAHRHTHSAVTHLHPHSPDIHHRHDHG